MNEPPASGLGDGRSPGLPDGYEPVSRCLFCGGESSEPVLAISRTPTNADRFPREPYDRLAGELFIRRCRACGLEYQAPRPAETRLLEVVAGSFPLYLEHPFNRAAFTRDLRALRPHVPSGATLLDVGCNIGEFGHYAGAEYRVIGCDPSAAAIAVAREKFSLSELYVGPLRAVPPGPVDAIVSLDSFEHLSEPTAFLREAAVRLRPGGILYLRTLRREGLNARLAGRNWYGYSIWHLFYPTIAQVRDWCRAAGLVPIRTFITSNGWTQLRGSVRYHALNGLSRLLPRVGRFREFRRAVDGGSRIFAFYRDEFALIARKPTG